MNTTTKAVAWLCIFSTFLMGCYTSTLISPTDSNREQLESGTIEYVVTKDSMKYVFEDTPDAPVIANDSIVGWVDTSQVSIPLSDVVQISTENVDWVATIGSSVLGLALVSGIVVGFIALGGGFDPFHDWP